MSIAPTWTGNHIFSKSGAASLATISITGVPFAGTGTTSFPIVYLNDANATASTTLNTAGTYLGVNGHGSADLLNLMKDGVSQLKVDSTGLATFSSSIVAVSGTFSGNAIYAGGGTFGGDTYVSHSNYPVIGAKDGSAICQLSVDSGSGYIQTNFNSLPINIQGTQTIVSSASGLVVNKNTTSKHYLGGSATPAIAAGTGAGTTPTVSVTGNDWAGVITVTTGTLPTLSAAVVTLTFAGAYAAAPYPTITPANANAATLSGLSMVYVTSTTTTFVLNAGATALTAATQYQWNYTVGG